jgi:hypothetical protein
MQGNEKVQHLSWPLAPARAVLNFQHLKVLESMITKEQKNITETFWFRTDINNLWLCPVTEFSKSKQNSAIKKRRNCIKLEPDKITLLKLLLDGMDGKWNPYRKSNTAKLTMLQARFDWVWRYWNVQVTVHAPSTGLIRIQHWTRKWWNLEFRNIRRCVQMAVILELQCDFHEKRHMIPK